MNKVRIGISKDEIVIMVGDPDCTEADQDYADIVLKGGQVRIITLDQYKEVKLYEPLPKSLQ